MVRILICDDEQDRLPRLVPDLIKKVFPQQEPTIMDAASAQKVAELVNAGTEFDIVISDVNFGNCREREGFLILRYVRAAPWGNKAHVILVSRSDLQEEVQQAGICEFIYDGGRNFQCEGCGAYFSEKDFREGRFAACKTPGCGALLGALERGLQVSLQQAFAK